MSDPVSPDSNTPAPLPQPPFPSQPPRPVGMPGRLAAPTLEDVVTTVEGRVVEVKYRGDAPGWLVEALRLLPESLGFSKFLAGMTALAKAEASGTTEQLAHEV